MEIPLIIRVPIPFTTFDPDAPDTEIYCANETPHSFLLSTQSTSFTTVDEDSGETASHGSAPMETIINPGDFILIAHVSGWEWDGHVGITVSFTNLHNQSTVIKNYNLKQGKGDFTYPQTGKSGRIVPALSY